MTLSAGVDISGTAAHVVVIDERSVIVSARIWPTAELQELADALASCSVVAIDSPDRWSPGAIPEHRDLSPKFVTARCAEFELARKHRYWVPWVTPSRETGESDPRFRWIRQGIGLFHLLRDRAGTEAIEVYPNAVFRHLAGGTMPSKKSTVAGLTARAELLAVHGIADPHLGMWSHDSLDAVAAAIVASHKSRGIGERVTCDHDGSAMWLPSPG